MIAVILDSNVLYGDPFFKSGFLKRLIAYSTLNVFDVLVSEVVLEEVINNNRDKIHVTLTKIKSQAKTINDVLGDQKLTVGSVDIELPEIQLRSKISDLCDLGAVTLVPYENELLPVIVSRALKKIRPFKEGKEAFRDSVIWLSCVEYLKSEKYKEAFIITNNSSDFCDPHNDEELHQDLKNDFSNIKLYRNLKSFFTTEKETWSEFVPSETSVELLEWFSENKPDITQLKELINDFFHSELRIALHQILSGISLHEIDHGLIGGYIQPYELDDFWVEDYDSTIDIDCFVVTGECVMLGFVELYQYNPVHDSSDEKFSFAGEREVEVTLEFIFSLSPDEGEPYDFDITGHKIQIS
ncbi:MAG: DUF4935 domain-containing protein [Pseudomonadales bacterium]|nr:DUF4935 domain-containing protein [Pseudomonadales bacterium]